MIVKRILLIISGGIAAYKSPEIVRCLRENGIETICLLTQGGAQFTTALALQTVSENKVYQHLFSLTDENEMGHIRLSREVDCVLVAPASANIIACMAQGLANDLATTTLLATNKPVVIAPSMNPQMWKHPATKQNIKTLKARGVRLVSPVEGEMVCGEFGIGRMADPLNIISTIIKPHNEKARLSGRRAVVTSGPTYEPIDVIRFIGNRSSGKQGHAIAKALANLGAETILISGPTTQPEPKGMSVVNVETATEMLAACKDSLPADILICAAAVSDWRVKDKSSIKLKKKAGVSHKNITLTENPDILAVLSNFPGNRPALAVGFAAETNDVVANAIKKRISKGCDWLLANDISQGTETIGGDQNQIHLISNDGVDTWPSMNKDEVGKNLARLIAKHFEKSQ